jgi:hypothetical protein
MARTARNPVVNIRDILPYEAFVIVGGIATRLYMPERKTDDADILIRASDRATVHERLRAGGAANVEELDLRGSTLRLSGSSWVLADGLSLDVIEGVGAWVERALSQPVTEPATGLPFVALPYLVLLKLDASRAQDVADLSRMLGAAAEPALDEVRQVVGRYMPDALDDVESLRAIGQLEHGAPAPSPMGQEREALRQVVASHLETETKHAAPIAKRKATLLGGAFAQWVATASDDVVGAHYRAIEDAQAPGERKLAMTALFKVAAESDPSLKTAYTAFLDAGRGDWW